MLKLDIILESGQFTKTIFIEMENPEEAVLQMVGPCQASRRVEGLRDACQRLALARSDPAIKIRVKINQNMPSVWLSGPQAKQKVEEEILHYKQLLGATGSSDYCSSCSVRMAMTLEIILLILPSNELQVLQALDQQLRLLRVRLEQFCLRR